jgi:SAM-dependent methyltransferase
VIGRSIIDIGAYDLNGSLRPFMQSLGANSYLGIDSRPGSGVDIVCTAEDLLDRFGPHCFDIVISTSTFEHIRHWRVALTNMKHVCRENGLIVFSVPVQWPFHAYPNDFWRFSASDITTLFADCHIMQLTIDEQPLAMTSQPPTPNPSGYVMAYAKIRKQKDFSECDLSGYGLHSIITGQRTVEIKDSDFLTPHFAITLWRDLIKPKLVRLALVFRLGIKHRAKTLVQTGRRLLRS